MNRLPCVSLFLLFSARLVAAQDNVTGWWSGTITETVRWSALSPAPCSNGTPAAFTVSGPGTLAIAQNGTRFAGSWLFSHNWSDHRDNGGLCSWIDNGPVRRVISGTVSGSTLTIDGCRSELVEDQCQRPFLPWSVSGSNVTGAFPDGPEPDDAVEHGTFTLVRQISNVPADGDITGWWSGTANETFFWDETSPQSCANGTPAPFSTSGQSTLAVAQNGSNFAGSITFPHTWSDHRNPDNGQCMWVDRGSALYAVSGTVSGSTINMQPIGTAQHFRGTFSVSGSTITGNFQADTESASLTLIKQSAAPSRRRSARH